MKEDVSYARGLLASLGWHIFAVVLLLGMSAWRGCQARRRPREMITFVELHTVQEDPPVAPVETPEPPAPRPPDPPPAIPEPAPEPRPRPTPVQRSERRVVRRQDPPPPALSEEEIRRRLEAAAGRPAPAAPRPTQDPWSGYLSLVRQAMYDAWAQPSELSPSAGHRSVVRIRVQRDGAVTRRELLRPSGNARMDTSVMAAAEQVHRLRPLPDTFRGAHRDIDIEFELTR